MPTFLRRALFGAIAPTLPTTVRGNSSASFAAESDGGRYAKLLGMGPWKQMMSPDLLAQVQDYDPLERIRNLWRVAAPNDPVARMQAVDLESYMPEDTLTKVDRASMLNSLEVRSPFLDHHLLETVSRIPSEVNVDGRGGKALLRDLLQSRVGDDVLNRPKRGFTLPLEAWFRADLAGELDRSFPILDPSSKVPPRSRTDDRPSPPTDRDSRTSRAPSGSSISSNIGLAHTCSGKSFLSPARFNRTYVTRNTLLNICFMCELSLAT